MRARSERIGGVEEGMARAIRLAHEAGGLVGAGSDLIGRDQKEYGMELGLVAEVVGAAKAIETMTLANARVIGRSDTIGSIEVGKQADLIAVEGDPLSEPSLFNDAARIALVIKDGRLEKSLLEKG